MAEQGVYRIRLVGLVILLWWTVRMASGAASWCFMDFVNLAFHEAGHLFLRPFGSTMHYLGGTIFQLLVPAVLVGYFLIKVRQPLGAAFSFWWIGESLINVSIYMGDARKLALPLVGGGDHDWNELFYRFGLLGEESVAAVSGATHALGVIVMVVGLLWWLFFVLPDRVQRELRSMARRRASWSELLLAG
jgi:hypothetical protein